MKKFADLVRHLDESNRTGHKVQALHDFFARSESADAAWAIALISGNRPRRPVNYNLMVEWACEYAAIDNWLFTECYEAVGDLGETLALILPENETQHNELPELAWWMENVILPLREIPLEQQKEAVLNAWIKLNTLERFIFNKLIGGSFRLGVSDKLLTQGLSKYSGIPQATIAARLMGKWEPTPYFYRSLIHPDTGSTDDSKPYPFCLAFPLDIEPAQLGKPEDWLAEWKWDGIRAQLIRRQGQTFLWSRGEELITERFQEISAESAQLPDGTVLDGEILGWKNEKPLSFLDLQKRIGRKSAGAKLMQDVPVIFMAYDLLEKQGADIRDKSLLLRRQYLAEILPVADSVLRLSPAIAFQSWDDLSAKRQESREHHTEGLMLKRLDSVYHAGRKRGDWWKWKIEPFLIDAVLVYAQRGTGRRAGLYTDYTFAVWDGETLVPFAKAYSGLTDEEIRQVDAYIRANTLERFGPVRTVKPELVFELAFEGLQESKRHKSGIAVRFPRINRWRKDKRPAEADSLETIRALLNSKHSI